MATQVAGVTLSSSPAKPVGSYGIRLAVLYGLAVLLLMAWVNNVFVFVRWLKIQDLSVNISGPIPWLNWSAVDYSTMTTFIPLVGVIGIIVGCHRIRSRHSNRPRPWFPFFEQYEGFTMACGLSGTVLGLILYGYDASRDSGPEAILVCMRTALFSTLMALVWYYFIYVFVAPRMRKAYANASTRAKMDQTDVLQSLNGLRDAAVGTAQELVRTETVTTSLNGSMTTVQRNLAGLAESLAQFRKLTGVDVHASLKSAVDGVSQAVTRLAAESDLRQRTLVQMQETAGKQVAVMKELETSLAAERAARERAEKELARKLDEVTAGAVKRSESLARKLRKARLTLTE